MCMSAWHTHFITEAPYAVSNVQLVKWLTVMANTTVLFRDMLCYYKTKPINNIDGSYVNMCHMYPKLKSSQTF